MELPMAPAAPPDDWLRLARRARWLSWASLGYMALEGIVALAAGVVAGSVVLVGFGIDSAIEGLASVIVVWRFTGSRLHSDRSEERAQRLVAISFFLLAPYIAVEALRDLLGAGRPGASWAGIGLAIASLVLMPVLGVAKQRIGRRIGSAATAGEGAQNLLCAAMAGALLLGLGGNALLGLWWLDPVAALGIAALAVREGVESWRGERCCGPGEALSVAECRLDAGGLRAQADRYRRLGATATRIERAGAALTGTFGPALDAALLHETIAVERQCCPFFAFDYDPARRRLSITVERPEQAPALDALHYALTGRDPG
jgi:hypothetical protein